MKYRTNKEINYIENKISYICQNEYQCFLSKANVEGIGLGYKIINGCNTFEKCINVFVNKKQNQSKLNYKELIPTTYKGFKTDVKEIGEITTDGLTAKVRPVTQGYSISLSPYSPSETTSGTTGCLITDGTDNYLLSNNHIFAEYGTAPIQNPILQPAKEDGGVEGEDVVAVLSKYISLNFITAFASPTNYVDCAIAKVTPKSIATPTIELVGIPNSTVIPTLDADVIKVGRTTALTIGKVTAIKSTIKVKCAKVGEKCLMKNQIFTNKMTTLGDSGAVLLDSNKNVMGLVMGSSKSVSIYNEIEEVLKALDVTLVTN